MDNLPPAFLLLAEFDPLRDEGLAYYKRLQEAGNDARHITYNTIHCFIGFGRYLAIGRLAIDDIIAYITMKMSKVN
jgi:acetyl esterase